eukprot:Opistho-2@17653
MPKRPLPGDDLNVNPPKRSAVVGLGGAGGGGSHKSRFLELDAFSRHKKLVNDYISYYGGSLKDFAAPGTAAANVKTDYDVLVEQHNNNPVLFYAGFCGMMKTTDRQVGRNASQKITTTSYSKSTASLI